MAASMDVVIEDAALKRYRPTEDFDVVQQEPLIEISPTDSTEFWLIQDPTNQLLPDDFHGKEISLKPYREDEIGKLVSSTGKSIKVTFAPQELDADIFLPLPKSRAVAKISRRVCLVHYPDASDLVKPRRQPPSISHISEESQKSGTSSHPLTASKARSTLRVAGTEAGTSHDTLTSTHTMVQSVESTKRSKHKKRSRDSSSQMGRSQMSHPESQVTDTSHGSTGVSSKKKKARD